VADFALTGSPDLSALPGGIHSGAFSGTEVALSSACPMSSAKVNRLPTNLEDEVAEPVSVVHWLAIFEAETLVVHVPKQVERFDAYVSALQEQFSVPSV
jgi:hypothetical protein